MKTMKDLTDADRTEVLNAAAKTWGTVAGDAAELGPITIGIGCELVLDAGRIRDIGKLNEQAFNKFMDLPYQVQEKFLKNNRGAWF